MKTASIDATGLKAIAGRRAKVAIVDGIAAALPSLAPRFGLDRPHRLAHFLSQTAHESAGFSTTREIWGPTAAQKRYEGRKDLGNVRRGDGARFKGHGLIQTTGRANHAAFTAWLRERIPDAPDFEAEPETLETFPWALLSAFWYWETRNLNALADQNNAEQITKRINGGLNGYPDRLAALGRALLVLSGYGVAADEVRRAQSDLGIKVDGDIGPATRTALFERLRNASEPPKMPKAAPLPPSPDGDVAIAEKLAARKKSAIEDVQRWLDQMGYHEVGAIDGRWGTRTRGAVLSFRADRALPLKPTIDDELLTALKIALAEGWRRPVGAERALKPASEIAKSSKTMRSSWWGRILTALGLGGGAAGNAAKDLLAPDQVESHLGTAQRLIGFVGDNWPLLLGVALAGGAAWGAFLLVERFRVKDEREGRHF